MIQLIENRSEVVASADFPSKGIFEFEAGIAEFQAFKVNPTGTAEEFEGLIDIPNETSGCLRVEAAIRFVDAEVIGFDIGPSIT